MPAFLLRTHPLHRGHTQRIQSDGDLSPARSMPTIVTHALIPLAAGIALGKARLPPRLVVAGMIAAVLPDADVIAFKLGIEYAHVFGHRGASHSLVFALVCGAFVACCARWLKVTPIAAFLFSTAFSLTNRSLWILRAQNGISLGCHSVLVQAATMLTRLRASPLTRIQALVQF